MIGAIIGDIVGSRFEFNNIDNIGFKLFDKGCSYTDDTICTVAIADALLNSNDYGDSLHNWCRRYPHPMGGYGGSFAAWVRSDNPQPYNSFGNGSAMRVSPIGWWYNAPELVTSRAAMSAQPTHSHPEGIKGAVATAMAIFIARTQGKTAMLESAKRLYPVWQTLSLGQNKFNETCQGTMPIVFGVLSLANSFEEAIRYAIAVGGDSDTIGAIVGSIAEAVWGVPKDMKEEALKYLPEEMVAVIKGFYKKLSNEKK